MTLTGEVDEELEQAMGSDMNGAVLGAGIVGPAQVIPAQVIPSGIAPLADSRTAGGPASAAAHAGERAISDELRVMAVEQTALRRLAKLAVQGALPGGTAGGSNRYCAGLHRPARDVRKAEPMTGASC